MLCDHLEGWGRDGEKETVWGYVMSLEATGFDLLAGWVGGMRRKDRSECNVWVAGLSS